MQVFHSRSKSSARQARHTYQAHQQHQQHSDKYKFHDWLLSVFHTGIPTNRLWDSETRITLLLYEGHMHFCVDIVRTSIQRWWWCVYAHPCDCRDKCLHVNGNRISWSPPCLYGGQKPEQKYVYKKSRIEWCRCCACCCFLLVWLMWVKHMFKYQLLSS